MIVPIELLRFLGNEFGNRVRFCTKYKRDIYTSRCHPCYQSDGPTFDWIAAVVINEAFYILDIDAKWYKLMVQITTNKQLAHKLSVLLIEWT